MSQTRHEDSRRHFFRDSSFLIAGALPVVAKAASGSDSEKPIRVGLVGCGKRGTAIGLSLLQSSEAEVVIDAAFDVRQDQVQRLYRSLRSIKPAAVRFDPRASKTDGLRGCVGDEIDAVVFATPPERRLDEVRLALSAAKHTFIEIPAVGGEAGIEELNRLLNQAAASELAFSFGHQRLACDATTEALLQVSRGSLGSVRHVHLLAAGGEQQPASLRIEQISDSMLAMREVLGDELAFVKKLEVAEFDRRVLSVIADVQKLKACRFRSSHGILLDVYEGVLEARNAIKKSELIDGELGSCDLSGCRIVNRHGKTVWRAQQRPINQRPSVDAWLAAICDNRRARISPAAGPLAAALRDAYSIHTTLNAMV